VWRPIVCANGLREYYDADGANHTLRIDIPPGQYAPKFVPRGTPGATTIAEALVSQDDHCSNALSIPASPDAVTVFPPADPMALSSPVWADPGLKAHVVPSPISAIGRGSRHAAIPAVLLLVFFGTAAALWNAPFRKTTKAAGGQIGNTAARIAGSGDVRILAGHVDGDYTDRLGRTWQADRYFQGGHVFETLDHPIMGTREPRVYQSRREGAFGYDIPLAAGVYEVRLHFAETLYGENNVAGGGESSRVFNVYINGKESLHEFDVISEAGPSTADVRTFKDITPAADGKLHLKFEPFTNPPLLSAIEITPGTSGRLRPIRMIALDRAYSDKQGTVWEPDSYSRGGQLVLRTKPVEGATDPELYRGERFGNLRYVIPVPPGRYGVTFYFAEAWFGPGTPPGGVWEAACSIF